MARAAPPSIAVIGAGMAGLACARLLADHRVGVSVFEKSRGLGGRLATRRVGALQFDHGAQYVMAWAQAFRAYRDICVAAGAAARWSPAGQTDADAEWLVGAPGMSALVRPLAIDLDIVQVTHIGAIAREGQGYALKAGDATSYGPFNGVVVAVPAPQALALLASVDPAFHALEKVRMSPCWSALVAFEGEAEARADVLRASSESIAWAARDSSKPGRPQGRDTWVIHATPAWSRAHLELDKAEVADLLLRDFLAVMPEPQKQPPAYIDAHRWRYALVETPLGQPFLRGTDPHLLAAGDWCIAPRVEAAFESGQAAARAMLSALPVV